MWTSGPWACRAPRRSRCPSCPCCAARWASAGWRPGSGARWVSAGGRGRARRGGHRRCPRSRRRRRRCSAPCLAGTGTGCAVKGARLGRPAGTPGAGRGLWRPTGSPDGRVLHRRGGREDGLLPLAVPLGRGRGGRLGQVGGTPWETRGLRLSPRAQEGPGFVLWGRTETPGHSRSGQGPGPGWAGGATWGQRGAAEPAAEVLGCGGEVGQAVHGRGGGARCRGHQHGQVWHLGQVDDACGGRWDGVEASGSCGLDRHPGGVLRPPRGTRFRMPGPPSPSLRSPPEKSGPTVGALLGVGSTPPPPLKRLA